MAKIDLKDYLERLEEPEDREAVASREYQKELFEQYVQKGDNFPELRAQLLKEYQDGADLTGPQGLRRKLGAFDLGYFGRAYLPHYFVRPSPPFHEELDRIFREGVMKGMNPSTDAKQISRANGCRRAVEAPRGHAKSTNFTFKDSIHSAVYAYKHYEIILSDSSEQAEGFLNDYVANTLYPRQMHVYETFEEPDTAEKTDAARQKPVPENKSRTPVLKKEEEQLFQEVMTEFLGG